MGSDSASLGRWLEGRTERWRALRTALERRRDLRSRSVGEVTELVGAFRSLGRDLSLARAVIPESRLRRDLEALFTQAYETIHRPAGRPRAALVELFRDDVPAIVRDLRGEIVASVLVFLGCVLAGWLLVATYPELIALFASKPMIDDVQRGVLWTDDLLNVVPSSVLSVSIMTNNIVVALTTYALGALYGLGTLYIIALNGTMLGAVFAFAHHHGLGERLFGFIVAHGVVELSVICLAGAAGLRVGEALVRPGARSRAEAYRDAVKQTSQLMLVLVLFLVGAGLVEGFVSPDAAFSLTARVTIGVAYGVVLWLVLSGRPWRARRVAAP